MGRLVEILDDPFSGQVERGKEGQGSQGHQRMKLRFWGGPSSLVRLAGPVQG